MNRFLPLFIIPPCSTFEMLFAFALFAKAVVLRLVVRVLAASASSSPSSRVESPPISSSSSNIACFDELFAVAVKLNCLPPLPPFSSLSLLLFLLFLNELVIKLVPGSAFFIGGGVVLFVSVVLTIAFIVAFIPKLLFALFAFASSAPKLNSSASSSELVSALSLFDDDALFAMDFSMDIAEFMMLDDDKRRWMDESALFGVVRSSSCTIRFSARVSAAALSVFATRKLARAIIIGLLECATFFQLCCISRITIACECVYRALRECRANPPTTTTARTTSNNATTTLLGDERTASSSSGGSSVPRRVNTCASRVFKIGVPVQIHNPM